MKDLDNAEDTSHGTTVFHQLEADLARMLEVDVGVDGVQVVVPGDLAQQLDDSLVNVPSEELEDLVGQWGQS